MLESRFDDNKAYSPKIKGYMEKGKKDAVEDMSKSREP